MNNKAPAPDTEPAARTKRRQVADPELIAYADLQSILDGLDSAAQKRAVAWINSRYGSVPVLKMEPLPGNCRAPRMADGPGA